MKKNLLVLFCITLFINEIHSQTNWELLNPKPTASTGKNIEFVTNDIGYIITSNEILETLDAGETWLKKQNISSGNDISFYNSIGYIVGNNAYVLKSTDNGASWSQVSTGFSGSFNTVNMIDADNIILSTSNSIVKTDDGGTTWERLFFPIPSVNKTFFTSALIGHAVCDGGTILKTVDGGLNWYITQSTNSIPSDFYTVYFINQSIGFATREHDDMFKTTDGGETWVEISQLSVAIFDFHFLDENNGFATGEYGATYKTTDGGTTWNQIFFQSAFVGGTSMYGIYFHDSNIGYATGARGRIIKTIDGGNTWMPHSLTYIDVRQIQFLNSNIGYAQSRNNFYKTTDGGDTWFLAGSLNLSSNIGNSEFTFVNENVGYSTTGGSNGGQVFKTVDGGVTWSILNNGFNIINEGIKSIFFLDENIGLVSGGFNFRRVMKTVDGGINWTQVESASFGHMQFINDQIGYAHTDKMYKTTDGGNTWNISFDLNKPIRWFHFVDENTGYFVGDQGLIFKTNDGGANWQDISTLYEWYKKVKFYSKNVGYVADEDGRLLKTENGGASWEFLTQHPLIYSLQIVNDKIYTGGSSGKIFRSDVDYEGITIHVNQAENISNSSATLTGNVTSNGTEISDINFEYSTNFSFNNSISVSFDNVAANESADLTIDLSNLEQSTTYFFRLQGTQNNIVNSSEMFSFTTLQDYELTTNFTHNYTSTTAILSGTIASYEHDITNVEFQYGLSSDALNNSINATPDMVIGNTTENITASLSNLQPETQYFYRIKATHQGEDIYGNMQSITTFPDYQLFLYTPNINGTDVTLSALLVSNFQDITDIAFEYGTIDYENTVATNPSQINTGNSADVTATISDLDPNLNYYYRLKGVINEEAFYSRDELFNFSGDIIVVNGAVEETPTNALELRGLINPYGTYLSNIHFEYGLTDSFGSSVIASPNVVFGSNTRLIKGLINNPLPNQTYYYRIVATHNGNTIYSDMYQYRTSTLSLTDSDLAQDISIYPNPATTFVHIKSNVYEQPKSIEFYNVLGQRVYFENVNNISDMKIEVSNFMKGLYFIKVNFENAKVVTSKLILN